MILIVVKFPIRPDRAEDWTQLRDYYTRECRAEEGTVFFEWSQSLEDPNTSVLVEGFRDAAAGQSHTRTDHFTTFVDKAPDIVAETPQIIYVDAPEVSGWGPMGEIQPRR